MHIHIHTQKQQILPHLQKKKNNNNNDEKETVNQFKIRAITSPENTMRFKKSTNSTKTACINIKIYFEANKKTTYF